MVNEILSFKIKTQTFLNKFLEQKLNGFILNYKKINYLISVHHNLPIDSVYNLLDQEKINININSGWSEALIMDTKTIDLTQLSINYKIQNRLPKPDEILFIKTNDQIYRTLVHDYEFIPFDNIHENLTIPYIRSKLDQTIESVSGLSGSPVFIGDTLIGVFSKFDVKESMAYIIPIYIIIKNLSKQDNMNIYGLPEELKFNKINSYNIKNNMVYHPTLKIVVPINTFLMIESDFNSKFSVRIDITNITINQIITKMIKLNVSNEIYIVNKEHEYKINSRLLILLKNFNVDKQIIIYLFNHISKNSCTFSVVDNKIQLI
jgi:hypothetical protein